MPPRLLLLALVFLFTTLQGAPRPAHGVGEDWANEFSLASSHLLELARAAPQELYSWRPAPGVRSFSEVLMHIAIANFGLLEQAGLEVPNMPPIDSDTEKSITGKANVIDFLIESQDAVRARHHRR